jgi:hypothetical protein
MATIKLKSLIKESFMSEAIDKDLEKAIHDNVVASANENYKKFSANSEYSTSNMPDWKLMPGSKFIRIVRDSSAWGFVATGDGTHKGIPYSMGDIFMAAGWNAPAKHVRGSAFEEGKEWNWTGPEYLK